ncbi:hypothetical protein EON64_12595 [archaeon]|nr:MAG: hypothetical protein EON64_12595 [archaeon]
MVPVKGPVTNAASVHESSNLVPPHVRVSPSKRFLDVDEVHKPMGSAIFEDPHHHDTAKPYSTTHVSLPSNTPSLCTDTRVEFDAEPLETFPPRVLSGQGALTGQCPNVYWRSIPVEHLRKHPLYQALPDVESVCIVSVRDLGLYAQDSWQWDALHQVG